MLFGCLIAGTAPASVRAESGTPRDESSFPNLRRPNLPIPTDGALLLGSEDVEDFVVEVLNPDGALIEGTLHRVGFDSNRALSSWKPSRLLTTGTHEVTIRHPNFPGREDVVSVEVVEPFADELPALQTEPSAIWEASPQERECCIIPNTIQGNVCFPTREEAVMRVQPGFSSASPQAILNQWLFRVSSAAGSRGADPNLISRPLEDPAHEVVFRKASDAYCIDVHAMNIATFEESVYSGLESCASHDNRELGSDIPIDVDPSVLTIENGCYEPPAEYKDAWCEANESACDTGEPSECELYEYVCEGAPLPAVWETVFGRDGGFIPDTLDGGMEEPFDAGSDASDMPPDPIDASFGPSADTGACAAAGPRSRSIGSAGLGGALVLLMLALRRSRLTPRRR